MFRNKLDYLLLMLMGIMMFISIRYTSNLVDWWDSFVNGKQMNFVSVIYLLCLIGILICVFIKYYGNNSK